MEPTLPQVFKTVARNTIFFLLALWHYGTNLGHVDGPTGDLARQVHHDEQQGLEEVELMVQHPA